MQSSLLCPLVSRDRITIKFHCVGTPEHRTAGADAAGVDLYQCNISVLLQLLSNAGKTAMLAGLPVQSQTKVELAAWQRRNRVLCSFRGQSCHFPIL